MIIIKQKSGKFAKNPCNYCGDKELASAETCENADTGLKYWDGSTEKTFDYKSFTETFPRTDEVAGTAYTYTVPISGIYKITVKGARGGHGFHTQGSGGNGSDGDGGSRANGQVITAKYFIKGGTTLSYIFGALGNGAESVGTRGYDAQTGGKGCHNGQDSSGGKKGHSNDYKSGAGGAGGGSTCVKIRTQTLIEAYGGGGGGGGGKGGALSSSDADDGDDASGSTRGAGGDGAGSWGADGGDGGNGGRYSDSSYSYYYSTTSGTDYYYKEGYDGTSSTNDGDGSIAIELISYAQCNTSCTFASTFTDANKKTGNCTGLPEDAVWSSNNSTSKTITQSLSGSSWSPSTTGTHSTNTSANQCYFKCKTNYVYESSQCKHEKISSCVALPSNAVWSSNNSTSKTVTQTYSGADGSGSWSPSTTGTYNASTAANQCYFKCNDGYHNESGTCVSSADRVYTCSGKPANAVWTYTNSDSQSYTQSWNGSAWTPAASSATQSNEASAAKCNYKCKDHYNNGSTCTADTRTFTCSGLPENAQWNSVSSYTQTWDGTEFAPVDSTATYNTTASTTSCRFKCKSGYDWKDGKCIKAHFNWGFESNLPGDWISQVSNTYWGRVSGSSSISGNSSNLPGAKEGSYAMCSTNSGEYHDTVANLIVKVTIPDDPVYKGTLSFNYTGTSEKSYDVFHVYLDPTQSDIDYNSASCSNSATQIVCTYGSDHSSWETVTISNLAPGEHKILFKYRKDGSVSTNADRYCIDNLSWDLTDALSCSGASLNSAPLYLKFNEGSGSTTANSGTAGGSYSISGGSWVSSVGSRGKAYNFNGSTTVSTNITKYTDNFTMMAWVKVTSDYTITLPSSQSSSGTNGTSGQHYLFGANHESSNAGAGLSVGTNGIFVTAHGDSYMPPLAVYSGDIGTGWHHVAVVFNSRTPYIYLDGNLVQTGATSQRTTYSPTSVGSGSYGSFYGAVDDVRIIGSALTSEQIKWEYYNNKNCSSL